MTVTASTLDQVCEKFEDLVRARAAFTFFPKDVWEDCVNKKFTNPKLLAKDQWKDPAKEIWAKRVESFETSIMTPLFIVKEEWDAIVRRYRLAKKDGKLRPRGTLKFADGSEADFIQSEIELQRAEIAGKRAVRGTFFCTLSYHNPDQIRRLRRKIIGRLKNRKHPVKVTSVAKFMGILNP